MNHLSFNIYVIHVSDVRTIKRLMPFIKIENTPGSAFYRVYLTNAQARLLKENGIDINLEFYQS